MPLFVPHTEVSDYRICTSTTRPSSPHEGLMIYETDTNTVLIWNGVAWREGWWEDAWGRMGSATTSANVTGITTAADITGLSVTFTAVANRMIRVTLMATGLSVTTANRNEIHITDGSNNILARSVNTHGAVSWEMSYACELFHTPSAGSMTYKGRAAVVAGGGSFTIGDNAGAARATLMVYDVGPNGAPA